MKLIRVCVGFTFAAAFSTLLHAGVVATPELDPSVVGTACLLIGGTVLIIRANRSANRKE